jgi:alanine or glycine:cation symporter, AGCS family
MTFLLKGLQFRKLYHSLWLALLKREGDKSVKTYRLLFVIIVFVGAVVKLDLVRTFTDIMNDLMALPNLIALLGLSGMVAAETRNYFNNSK